MSGVNEIKLEFKSKADNVAIARSLIAAVVAQVDVRLSELEEIKLAVSEAVTNAVIHAYPGAEVGLIIMTVRLDRMFLAVKIEDFGCGIADIRRALEPGVSDNDESMGLGFSFMQAMTDRLEVSSTVGEGTIVYMEKLFGEAAAGGLADEQ